MIKKIQHSKNNYYFHFHFHFISFSFIQFFCYGCMFFRTVTVIECWNMIKKYNTQKIIIIFIFIFISFSSNKIEESYCKWKMLGNFSNLFSCFAMGACFFAQLPLLSVIYRQLASSMVASMANCAWLIPVRHGKKKGTQKARDSKCDKDSLLVTSETLYGTE